MNALNTIRIPFEIIKKSMLNCICRIQFTQFITFEKFVLKKLIYQFDGKPKNKKIKISRGIKTITTNINF